VISTSEIIALSLLVVWLSLSVLIQLNIASKISFISRIAIVPNWRFFGPKPLMDDFYLLYRTASRTGVVSDWREIVLSRRGSWFAMIWNPERRLKKAQFDMIVSLARHTADHPDSVLLSVPYVSLLTVAEREARASDAERVQFSVFLRSVSNPHEAIDLLFASDFHPIVRA